MNFEQKKKIAQRVWEADDKEDQRSSPRFFRPPLDLQMVAAWEPKEGERVRDLYRSNTGTL